MVWNYLQILCLIVGLTSSLGQGQNLGKKKNRFEEAQTCPSCYELQHKEWRGSIMHYSTVSPVCHSVSGPLIFGSFHDTCFRNTDVSSTYLKSSPFSNSCHDVRPPIPDVGTGEPFQRLENIFTRKAVLSVSGEVKFMNLKVLGKGFPKKWREEYLFS